MVADTKHHREELKRQRLQNSGSKPEREEYFRLRAVVDQKTTSHFERYVELCPAVANAIGQRTGALESQKLHLPSSLTAPRRLALGLKKMGDVEVRLRIGQAHESLRKVRDFLGLKDKLVKTKKAHVHGYKQVTRSETAIRNAQKLLNQAAQSYSRAFQCLERLGCPMGIGTDAGPLQQLRDSDLVPLSHWTGAEGGVFNRKAERRVPWLWRITAQAGADVTEESWATEGTLPGPVLDLADAACTCSSSTRMAPCHGCPRSLVGGACSALRGATTRGSDLSLGRGAMDGARAMDGMGPWTASSA